MADIATTYTLATSAGTIVFNNGDLGDGTDKFWVQRVQGLDGPRVRAPIDDVPFGHGSILHDFWRGGRRPLFEGVLVIETVPLNSALCQQAINTLEAALTAAIDSLVTTAGTLSWTPAGQGAKALTVRHHGEPELDFIPIENFMLRQFLFGLVSASASY
jgi:hypothetical protein